ncbi:probable xyloglucan endotransglucosylase/hydrolase protein 11 isoform X1 [Raphanus sativus]|uniref:Xyloglucan endotransglucosylase/hydrolase n=1 Tax=Raphanus sativus TaxID=3726 RepID=A0A6J0NTX5_RAPSA|nr:probable xyloglucan endotransglucosylase/hydrolase protein 11 isoform X1 [Raphanus sativus]
MKMSGPHEKILLLIGIMVLTVAARAIDEDLTGFVTWGHNYYKTWGHPALVINETSELDLTLDHKSGSGFESNSIYGSGSFSMKIKAPQTKSTRVVTSFYLRSKSSRNDQLCFQIFGNGPAYLLNTNIIINGEGAKDQRFRLWFYVDDTPIRVYKKNPSIPYPSGQTMFMHGSVKNGSIVDPNEMPYTAKFQASTIDGCVTDFLDIEKCFGPQFWWNRKENWQLSSRERKMYMSARKVYMDYDYCSDRKLYPKVPKECKSRN